MLTKIVCEKYWLVGKNMSLDNFKKDVKKIISVCSVSEIQASCYLCNFEDEYICHKYDGGCKNIEICRNIRKNTQ